MENYYYYFIFLKEPAHNTDSTSTEQLFIYNLIYIITSPKYMLQLQTLKCA